MSTAEERRKILNMVAEGKISAEEGAQLLGALQKASRQTPGRNEAAVGAGGARYFRVRITDASGKTKINVSLPINLIDVGLKMGARFVPDLQDSELEDILQAVREGAQGRIAAIQDEEDGEFVEIFVE
jgi:hypothetical protein